MQFTCPNCKGSMIIQPDQAGQLVDCPHCKAMVEIPFRIPGTRQDDQLRILSKSRANDMSERELKKGDTLCFWLGFLFSLFGVLISAIIRGEKGCRSALKGLIFEIAVSTFIIVTYVFAVMIFSH